MKCKILKISFSYFVYFYEFYKLLKVNIRIIPLLSYRLDYCQKHLFNDDKPFNHKKMNNIKQ
jgi:hypothetical protein